MVDPNYFLKYLNDEINALLTKDYINPKELDAINNKVFECWKYFKKEQQESLGPALAQLEERVKFQREPESYAQLEQELSDKITNEHEKWRGDSDDIISNKESFFEIESIFDDYEKRIESLKGNEEILDEKERAETLDKQKSLLREKLNDLLSLVVKSILKVNVDRLKWHRDQFQKLYPEQFQKLFPKGILPQDELKAYLRIRSFLEKTGVQAVQERFNAFIKEQDYNYSAVMDVAEALYPIEVVTYPFHDQIFQKLIVNGTVEDLRKFFLSPTKKKERELFRSNWFNIFSYRLWAKPLNQEATKEYYASPRGVAAIEECLEFVKWSRDVMKIRLTEPELKHAIEQTEGMVDFSYKFIEILPELRKMLKKD